MKKDPTKDKLRGGYYTPVEITDFLTKWAIHNPDDHVLEPSCGDGNFLESVVARLSELGKQSHELSSQIYATEIDKIELKKTSKRLKNLGVTLSKSNVVNGDFFSYCSKQLDNKKKFDVVIGNPPFIRYQNFPDIYRETAFSLMKRFGFNPNKLTNIWVPFLVLSSLLLKPTGKLAMVIPAELFQVGYAGETRKFLSDYFSKINIVTFKKLLFKGIQQEVVLLLAQKNGKTNSGIRTFELFNMEDLRKFSESVVDKTELKPIDHDNEKWIKYFLEIPEILFLRQLRESKQTERLSKFIDVDVGVVTGQNDFFVIDENNVKNWNIRRYTQKILARSNQARGINYDHNDWESDAKEGKKVFLLNLPNKPKDSISKKALAYVEHGESHNYHTGYKCRIRKNWYKVPSLWDPDLFSLRQVHLHPKLIKNSVDATCTDTIHRARIIGDIDPDILCSIFINSMTFAFSEITGRSYGGGVLTFEPSEIEKLIVPTLKSWKNINPRWTDAEIRNGNIYKVLDRHDEIILHQNLGLSKKKIRILRHIWEKLRDRRISRK